MTVVIPRGSLMESAMAGQRIAVTLTDSDVLADAARALTDAVGEMGNLPVFAVGHNAALIVGAATIWSKGAVRQAVLPSAGGSDRKVLAVEAVAIGQGVLESAVIEARLGGADWVGAWVWAASMRMSEDRVDADAVRFSRHCDF